MTDTEKTCRDEYRKIRRAVRKNELSFQQMLLIKEGMVNSALYCYDLNCLSVFREYCDVMAELNLEIDLYFAKYRRPVCILLNILGKIYFSVKYYDRFTITVKYFDLISSIKD